MAALDDVASRLEGSPFISARPVSRGARVKIQFSRTPPSKPGVYIVYDCSDSENPEPFYVGEARDLSKRLTILFRCKSPAKNPHPCQSYYAKVKDVSVTEITCNEFCSRFRVRLFCTEGHLGRKEIEEFLQRRLGTNRDKFYRGL